MKLFNTGDPQAKPSVVMVVYGEGGVGKTTFSATAPKPILADCENGSKYFGLRGIKTDVALIEKWADTREFLQLAQQGDYETIVIDPIGELMEKLNRYMIAQNDPKLVQRDGNPTMAGWGWLKKTMRDLLKVVRDTGKHVIIIAHLEEKDDEGRIVKRPMVQTKLSAELINMVDIVAYMTVVRDEDGGDKRVLLVDPTSDKIVAKDRTGMLGKVVEPDFEKIVKAVQGTEKYAWSNALPEKPANDADVPPFEDKPIVPPDPTDQKVTTEEIDELMKKPEPAKAKK